MLKLNVNKEQAQEIVAKVEELRTNRQSSFDSNSKETCPQKMSNVISSNSKVKEPKYIGYGGVEYYGDYAPLSWYIKNCSERCENHEEYFNQFTEEDLMEAEKKVSEFYDARNCSGEICNAYDIFLSAICYAKNYSIELKAKEKK